MKNIIDSSLKDVLCFIDRISQTANIDYMIAGATARDIIFWNIHGIQTIRATLDVDVAICLRSWDEYLLFKKHMFLDNHVHEKASDKRLYYKNWPIDLIPFGQIAENNKILWPPNNEVEFNVTGFTEVFERPLKLSVDQSIIKIAPITGLVILKLISWNDKPDERTKDIQDISFIVNNYDRVNADNRLFEQHKDLLLNDNFDYVEAWTRILGRDIYNDFGKRICEILLKILKTHLIEGKEEYSLLLSTFHQNNRAKTDQECLNLLEALMRGLGDLI